MNLMYFVSQIKVSHDMQMAYNLTLTTRIQVVNTYWMIWCELGQNSGK